MKNYFEVKAAYQKIDQTSGKTKKVTEPYLIDAVTFSEAEERIAEILASAVSGEFTIKSIAKSNVQDAYFYEAGEFWFKCKMVFEDLDNESGKTKKVVNYFLVTADTAKEAYIRLKDIHKDMIVPFEIPSVVLSPIVDVFEYDPSGEITE